MPARSPLSRRDLETVIAVEGEVRFVLQRNSQLSPILRVRSPTGDLKQPAPPVQKAITGIHVAEPTAIDVVAELLLVVGVLLRDLDGGEATRPHRHQSRRRVQQALRLDPQAARFLEHLREEVRQSEAVGANLVFGKQVVDAVRTEGGRVFIDHVRHDGLNLCKRYLHRCVSLQKRHVS